MNDNSDQDSPTGVASHPTRHGWLSYIQIPTANPHESATFYERVFGWKIRGRDTDHPRFDDGSDSISGAWVTDRAISREPGLLPYLFVENIDHTIEQIKVQGGTIVKAPFPEGDLWVATFRDPSGNVLGIFQQGAR